MCKLKKLVALIILCMSCSFVYGQDVHDFYVIKQYDDSYLCHFFPVTLFKMDKKKAVEYDLTYTSADDKTVMNFTYILDDILEIDSLKYVSGDVVICSEVKQFFIEPYKSKKWKHRYSLSTDGVKILSIYRNGVQPQITLYSRGEEYIYNVIQKEWDKYIPIAQKISKILEHKNN